jgi:hypothetical protein
MKRSEPMNCGPGWNPEPVRALWSRETSLVVFGNKTTIFVCPIHSTVTIPTELSRLPLQILLQWQAGKWEFEYEIVVGKPEDNASGRCRYDGDNDDDDDNDIIIIIILILIIIIIIRVLRNQVWSLEVNSTI